MALLLRQFFGFSMGLYFIVLGLIFPIIHQPIDFSGAESKNTISAVSFWENFDVDNAVISADLTSAPSQKEYSGENPYFDTYIAHAYCLASFIKCRIEITARVFVAFGIKELKFPSHYFW